MFQRAAFVALVAYTVFLVSGASALPTPATQSDLAVGRSVQIVDTRDTGRTVEARWSRNGFDGHTNGQAIPKRAVVPGGPSNGFNGRTVEARWSRNGFDGHTNGQAIPKRAVVPGGPSNGFNGRAVVEARGVVGRPDRGFNGNRIEVVEARGEGSANGTPDHGFNGIVPAAPEQRRNAWNPDHGYHGTAALETRQHPCCDGHVPGNDKRSPEPIRILSAGDVPALDRRAIEKRVSVQVMQRIVQG